jgi:uncharacterized protein involved in response to NO
MAIVGITDPARTPRNWAPFELAFRPFFLLAGLGAVLLVALWGHAFARGTLGDGYYGFIGWHSHEMLFGYAVAVIAGFLLTAARNWTGVQTLRGLPLALLALLWLLARVFALLPAPHWLIALLDLAFLPWAALALLLPLLKARHYKSLMFVAILLALALANLLVHLQLLGATKATANAGIYFATGVILLLIVIMGGRVIPFFTEKGVSTGFVRREWRWVEAAAPLSVLTLALVEGFLPQPLLVAPVAAVAAVVNGIRLSGWYTHAIWRAPLVWVLQVGYAWLVLGLALKAVAAAGGFGSLLALHALTIGTIGGITLGMMARVALGHTGRSLEAPRVMPWAFALLYGAALLRVFLPLLVSSYTLTVVLSALFWSAAFALFVWGYGMMLLKPRVDGMPG